MEQQSVFETARPSHLAVPRTRSRLPRLFGRYLVEAGAIGAKDVAEALALMRLVNSPMGEIAVGEGLLSNVQVQTILDAQRQVDERFVELAASMGLGGDQLESLCSEQAVENLRFGDALVEVGAITSTALEEHLRIYDREDHWPAPSMPRTASDFARTTADLVPRLARRTIGSTMRFSAPRDWDGNGLDVHATASGNGDGGLCLGISVDHKVAAGLGPQESAPATSWARQLAPVFLADFAGLAVNMAQRKLGFDRDLSLSPGELPIRGLCFDVALESGAGILVIDAD
ncbi:MAG: hypothetical protein KUG77_14405 [Nannocystaceae bacterium]|nr:hypothetical protein [Nannocystaceae bacterium]